MTDVDVAKRKIRDGTASILDMLLVHPELLDETPDPLKVALDADAADALAARSTKRKRR